MTSHDPRPTPAQRLATLREDSAPGRSTPYVCFWNPGPGLGCLSQWAVAPFEVDGQAYPTAEHWMMAEKARVFGDDEALARVLASTEPEVAKAVGREVRGFDSATWSAAAYDVVVRGNLAKFGAHDDLAEVLRDTGDRVLVEASPHDRVWGIGLAADHPDVGSPTAWPGLNLLGFALMEVRERLAY